MMPKYMKEFHWDYHIKRRVGLNHDIYGKKLYQFPIMTRTCVTAKDAIVYLDEVIKRTEYSLDVVMFRFQLYCRFLRTTFRQVERHTLNQKLDFSFSEHNPRALIYYLMWNAATVSGNLVRAIEHMVSDEFILVADEAKTLADSIRVGVGHVFSEFFTLYINQPKSVRDQVKKSLGESQQVRMERERRI